MLEVTEVARVLGSALPFMMVSTGKPQEINKTRLLETVIQSLLVASAVGLGGYFVAFPVLQEQMAQTRREAIEIKLLVKEMRADIKVEMEQRAARRDMTEAVQDAKIYQLQMENARLRR